MLPMCACVACWLKRGIPFSRCVRKNQNFASCSETGYGGCNALDRHLADPEMFRTGV